MYKANGLVIVSWWSVEVDLNNFQISPITTTTFMPEGSVAQRTDFKKMAEEWILKVLITMDSMRWQSIAGDAEFYGPQETSDVVRN